MLLLLLALYGCAPIDGLRLISGLEPRNNNNFPRSPGANLPSDCRRVGRRQLETFDCLIVAGRAGHLTRLDSSRLPILGRLNDGLH